MNAPDNIRRPVHRPRSARAIWFYTQCRNWHGYLSAFAFLALMFFSVTGILLNHPDWFAADEAEPMTVTAQIAAADIAAARKSTDAGSALASLAARNLPLSGTYSSADIDGSQAVLRFEGVKGSSSVSIDLANGAAQARIQKATMLSVLDDLHRGKNVGAVWQAVIDLSGGLVLVLSLLGYILFFAMRFRLRTSLVLTMVSLGILGGVVVLFVP